MDHASKPSERIDAACALLDRGWDRPAQAVLTAQIEEGLSMIRQKRARNPEGRSLTSLRASGAGAAEVWPGMMRNPMRFSDRIEPVMPKLVCCVAAVGLAVVLTAPVRARPALRHEMLLDALVQVVPSGGLRLGSGALVHPFLATKTSDPLPFADRLGCHCCATAHF